jgi:thioredoxin 1
MTGKAELVGQADFETKVISASDPVLVDFFADWCAPCRAVGPVVDRFAAENADRIRVYKVDVDADPALASRYGVRSIPTLMLFRNGVPVETLVGVVAPGQLSGILDRAA